MWIPDHLTCLLRNLYAGQEATVRTGHGTTEWFQIGKGERQGCILSPCLFNFYVEYIMRNAGLEETQAGIKIAWRNINNLRYADDTTLMAESEEELKSLLIKGKEESERVDHSLTFRKLRSWHLVPSVQFSSVAQSCPTLCDPMNCNTPGLPIHHQLPEFIQTHDVSRWCHPAISSSVIPFSSCRQSLPASGSFPMSQLYAWGGQSIGVSTLASVLPKNTQDWSPLGWTGWIPLQSKGLSRVFSNTTVQNHQFFGAPPSSQSNSHIHKNHWKNNGLE